MEIIRGTGPEGSTTILRLKGPLTLSTASFLQDKLPEIPASDTVIDVSEVRYIDSTGLGAILGHWSRSNRAGHKFALAGVNPRAEMLLKIAHVDTLFPIFKTAEEADDSFTGRA